MHVQKQVSRGEVWWWYENNLARKDQCRVEAAIMRAKDLKGIEGVETKMIMSLVGHEYRTGMW